MNYKIIVLLIIIIISIFLIIRYFDNLHRDNLHATSTIISCINDHTKLLKHDLNNCVIKIKALNCDFIEQVRKMNEYGSQHITNMSNHYTETNQDNDNNKGNISYLSDANDKTSLYMSEYTNSKKKSYKSSPSKQFNISSSLTVSCVPYNNVRCGLGCSP